MFLHHRLDQKHDQFAVHSQKQISLRVRSRKDSDFVRVVWQWTRAKDLKYVIALLGLFLLYVVVVHAVLEVWKGNAAAVVEQGQMGLSLNFIVFSHGRLLLPFLIHRLS